jgi:hypothetical protein
MMNLQRRDILHLDPSRQGEAKGRNR